MSLATLSADVGFFSRRRTAALTVLGSAGGTQLLSLAPHLTRNHAVIWVGAHGVLIVAAVWVGSEVLSHRVLRSLDRRYRSNPRDLVATRSADEVHSAVSDLHRGRRESGEDGDGVSEHESRSA